MVNLTINGIPVSVPKGTTILKAAKQIGINIPHLCYLEDINEIGACRICVVECKGMEKLITSCNNEVIEGMEILTHSPKVRNIRRINVELILSDHDCRCATCVRSGNCALQTIANDLGILDVHYQYVAEKSRWDCNYPLIRDASKCIKCMVCIQICDKVQDLNVWDISGTGYRTTVGVSENKDIKDADCVLCGQCITHCPVGALRERNDTENLYKAIADPEKIVMVQVAPAVRAAWGEEVGLSSEEATVGRMVNALKRIGVDYVFDTTYSADLTIMEEGSEFLQKLQNREEHNWPMFTSCCPGWVRFMKTQYPDMVDQLSTAKSPQQMFGTMAKTYIAQKLNVDPEKIYCASIMPCVAKKYEHQVPEVNLNEDKLDVDLVITTREFARLVRTQHINSIDLVEEDFDNIFGVGSGAGVIFGATGGVMEAALRTAYYLVTGKNPNPDSFKSVRGMDGWKEADFMIEGILIKVAIVSGMGNTRKLMTAIRNKEVEYDFVEVMACPGGCAGGGGQPIHDGEEFAEFRNKILYGLDKMDNIRFSHENPSIKLTYEEFLGEPLSHKSHELLHTDASKWTLDVTKI